MTLYRDGAEGRATTLRSTIRYVCLTVEVTDAESPQRRAEPREWLRSRELAKRLSPEDDAAASPAAMATVFRPTPLPRVGAMCRARNHLTVIAVPPIVVVRTCF